MSSIENGVPNVNIGQAALQRLDVRPRDGQVTSNELNLGFQQDQVMFDAQGVVVVNPIALVETSNVSPSYAAIQRFATNALREDLLSRGNGQQRAESLVSSLRAMRKLAEPGSQADGAIHRALMSIPDLTHYGVYGVEYNKSAVQQLRTKIDAIIELPPAAFNRSSS